MSRYFWLRTAQIAGWMLLVACSAGGLVIIDLGYFLPGAAVMILGFGDGH